MLDSQSDIHSTRVLHVYVQVGAIFLGRVQSTRFRRNRKTDKRRRSIVIVCIHLYISYSCVVYKKGGKTVMVK